MSSYFLLRIYLLLNVCLLMLSPCKGTIGAQKPHYPLGNYHASHLLYVLFPGHNHLLTTGADDPSLTGAQAIIKVSDHQLAGGYDLEIGHF